MTKMPTTHDLDTDEVAELLRNLAHAIEENKTALTGVKTGTEMDAKEERTLSCSLKIEYTPSDPVLIPGKRLSEGMEVFDE